MELNECNIVLIEKLLKRMVHLEQYVEKVIDYTSRFNNSNSIFFAPLNISGKYLKYPSYGDFPEAYCLRTYGKWWKMSEGAQINYRPQDIDPLGAEEYMTLDFQTAVIPRDICIYEIYNPGAIIRIWGKLLDGKYRWILLWEGLPQTCSDKSRKFHPNIKKINHLIKQVRLEFNQTYLKGHMSIDAVLLGGWEPTTPLQYNMILKGLIEVPVFESINNQQNVVNEFICDKIDSFTNLPYEVIIHIFQYLDLKSLSKCTQVNKRWLIAASDPVLYQNISLKKYWSLVNCDTLNYFSLKCATLKKLDLSWCGTDINDFPDKLKFILEKNCSSLTHLSLCNCVVTNEIIDAISNCKELIDLRLKNTTDWTNSSLNRLNKLISIDLTATNINDNDLIALFMSNLRLKHIIIDLCENLNRLDQVCDILVKYNPNLITWSSWKTKSLTYEGVKCFKNCPYLKELDLGWCLLSTDPGDCLEKIANGCRNLTRLIISEWRGVHDHLLMPIILNCKNLNQLDLLGIINITSELCEQALVLLPKLRLLEISYCDLIRQDQVEIWREQYPHITIQRSCQDVVNDYLN